MSGQGDPNASKNDFYILWVIFGVFGVAWLIWYFFQEQLKTAFWYVKKYELEFISLFTDKLDAQITILNNTPPSTLDVDSAQLIAMGVGSALNIPLVIILAILCVWMLVGHKGIRWTRAYDMNTLVAQEQNNYPQIAPIVKLDLISQDSLKGPWAMSENPMQFGRHYKLFKVERVPSSKAAYRAEGECKVTVLVDRARRVFSLQLGALWKSPMHLPPHTQALFAVFAARAAHDIPAAAAVLNTLSASAARGKMDYSGVMPLLKKYQNDKAVQRCVSRHAFVNTVMASMLLLARTDGVLASADFLWLKPLDRRLWYVLNNAGRQVAVPEVAGVFAHLKAEREMGRPLRTPVVEQAVKAFEFAISMTVYIPAEGEEIPIAQE